MNDALSYVVNNVENFGSSGVRSLLGHELLGLVYLVDVLGLDSIYRRSSPDFVSNNIGFEIKSRRGFSLTRAQVESIYEYDNVFVLVVGDDMYSTLDTIEDESIDEIIKVSGEFRTMTKDELRSYLVDKQVINT